MDSLEPTTNKYFARVLISSPSIVLIVAVFFHPGSGPRLINVPLAPWLRPPVMILVASL